MDAIAWRSGWAGENVSYSPIWSGGRWHIIQLLIDDGVPSRGHRKALLTSEYRLTGVACGEHPDYREMCSMDYATRFSDRREP